MTIPTSGAITFVAVLLDEDGQVKNVATFSTQVQLDLWVDGEPDEWTALVWGTIVDAPDAQNRSIH